MVMPREFFRHVRASHNSLIVYKCHDAKPCDGYRELQELSLRKLNARTVSDDAIYSVFGRSNDAGTSLVRSADDDVAESLVVAL